MVLIDGKSSVPWLVVALIGGFLVVHIESKGFTEEQKEEFVKVMKECAAESKIPEAEFEAMTSERKPPVSKEGECFVKCIMEKNDVIANNEVNKVGVAATLEEMIEDKPKLAKAKEILEECTKSVEPLAKGDSCEFAAKFGGCVHSKLKDSGIIGPKF
uniref:Odorant-binding protein 3 n=1 Tax=Helopeltis theivora TaxID=393766 RepID=A0A6B9RZ66_9HEMI|nr:odorant-binding protein 3 [Helopeltis theivora]